jgi:hypothetical protein
VTTQITVAKETRTVLVIFKQADPEYFKKIRKVQILKLSGVGNYWQVISGIGQ